MSPLLSVDQVSSGYGPVQVLWDVSLDVKPDEIVCLIGSNGAGKTTLLRTISGVLRAKGGAIRFQGEEISGLAGSEVVTRGIAHVPEGRRLFRPMSVHDNLLMGAYRRRSKADVNSDLERVYSLFPILAERRHQAAGTLSGGEQQMCAIGRAIMSSPKLLLVDELSLGLAPRIVELIASTIISIRKMGISILLVEQDVTTAFELADRGFLMDMGRITLGASTRELVDDPEIKKAYVGV